MQQHYWSRYYMTREELEADTATPRGCDYVDFSRDALAHNVFLRLGARYPRQHRQLAPAPAPPMKIG